MAVRLRYHKAGALESNSALGLPDIIFESLAEGN